MLNVASEIGHWFLITALIFAFIATAGHLMGLIVVPRWWKLAGLVGAIALLALTVIGYALGQENAGGIVKTPGMVAKDELMTRP